MFIVSWTFQKEKKLTEVFPCKIFAQNLLPISQVVIPNDGRVFGALIGQLIGQTRVEVPLARVVAIVMFADCVNEEVPMKKEA